LYFYPTLEIYQITHLKQKFFSLGPGITEVIQAFHPHCSIILDASEEYTFQEAIVVLEKLHGISALFLHLKF
jgi:hypothetical protein